MSKIDNFSSLLAAKILCSLSKWNITNLQIQKILYLSHMLYCGRYKTPLITDEEFEAWDYGPVLPKLYHEFKFFGRGKIRDIHSHITDLQNNSAQYKFLSRAYDYLSKFSSSQLVATTHRSTGAWAKNYDPQFINKKILCIKNYPFFSLPV